MKSFVDNLIKDDLAFIWHPCSQMKEARDFPIMPIKRGSGVYVYDFYDNKYIDCISSWWVNLFGHNHPYITQKLKEQIDKIEHIIFAGYTYEGIVQFSKRLINLMPRKLDKVFYADNGSSAIEVALKMSYHLRIFAESNSQNRTLSHKNASKNPIFLSLENSYHGETIGALSVGDVGIYKNNYEEILISNLQVPVPRDSNEIDSALNAMKAIIENNDIIAFILEPLVQCAGGMRVYPKEFVKKACELARSYGIYVVFDEIAVGFGRCGAMFAFEICDFVPDFLCLSKGITGGYLPLSVVVTSDEIYGEFLGDINRAFLHSHSYTGNPLAVACANAVLDLFESEGVLERNKAMSEFIWERFLALGKFDFVKNIRRQGMIFAFDVEGEFRLRGRFSLCVSEMALKNGLILRPLGQSVYFMPPYVIDESEVCFVIDGLQKILHLLKELRK